MPRKQRSPAMADRSGLGVVGFIYGSVTGFVMLIAIGVVFGHIDGSQALDAPPPSTLSAR
jgi:hypothetical protein